MARVKPITGYIVNPDRVDDVVSPAYDAMTPAQRHVFAESHPGNYLNVMRSREEFPVDQCPTLDELLVRNGDRLQCMIEDGDFIPQSRPGYFIYRLAVDGHEQTGLVAELPVSEYLDGLVKKHEHTQTLKEDDLTEYQRVVRASSSPICLTYPASAEIDSLLGELTESTPALDFVSDDGCRQQVWIIADFTDVERIEAAYAAVPVTYLTDGHHRTASAVRFMTLEQEANPSHNGDESYNQMLVSFFPAEQLRILEYNRFIRAPHANSEEEMLEAVSESFEVERLEVNTAGEVRPRRRGEFAMFAFGARFRLSIKPGLVPVDVVDALDVSLLQDRLLEPVFGVEDPRNDPRVGYMSGALSLQQLEQQCVDEDQIGFAVYPTAIEDLMAVADAERVMPPKSTWFDPKLRSGIFLLLR